MEQTPGYRFGARAVVFSATFYAVVLGVALGVGALWPSVLGVTWTSAPLTDLWIGLAAGAGIAALSWPFATRFAAGRRLSERLAETLHGIPWWGMVVLSVAAGLAEEAVFRGCLWTLAEGVGGAWVALVATAVLFGAAHGLFMGRFLAWSAFALATGLALGGVRLATGGVLAPVIAHALVDLVNIPMVLATARRKA